VTDVIFPLGNKREYEDVPEDLKQGITPHFVDNYEQVFDLALPEGFKQLQSGSSSKQQQQPAGAGAAGGVAAAAAGGRLHLSRQ
jgi:glycerate kinase